MGSDWIVKEVSSHLNPMVCLRAGRFRARGHDAGPLNTMNNDQEILLD